MTDCVLGVSLGTCGAAEASPLAAAAAPPSGRFAGSLGSCVGFARPCGRLASSCAVGCGIAGEFGVGCAGSLTVCGIGLFGADVGCSFLHAIAPEATVARAAAAM